MTKVFIGGSRRISKLNKEIKNRLDKFLQDRWTILVGDANGVDKAVQNHLLEKKYTNALVFCAGNKCRNNVGKWHVRNVKVESRNRNSNYYVAKDLQMVDEADSGFMIWDAKSKGTLRNILNMLKKSKKAMVYFSPERNFYELSKFDDLRGLLSKCDKETLEALEKEFNLQIVYPTRDEQSLETAVECLKDTQLMLWSPGDIVVRDK